MAKPRILTDIAIDCALHSLSDPKNGWRNLIPSKDLGQMPYGGSGQIGLQALVAQLHYNKAQAIPALLNYYETCKGGRFMLSEPWSAIYGYAIVACWLATVIIAERHGFHDIAGKYRSLLSTWAATCSLMRSEPSGLVLAAGCRSWGQPLKPIGFTKPWAIASGRLNAKNHGKPGVDDDWGWRDRCFYMGQGILRQEAAQWVGKDPLWLVANAPRWGARTEMCLYGWKDGSRFWTMGDDEAGMDDEDANSNTPGILGAGEIGGKAVQLPNWPAKHWDDKKLITVDHIRQTTVFADIDGRFTEGWILYHSHIGDTYENGYHVTRLPAYKPDEILFAIRIPADTDGYEYPVWKDMLSDGPVIWESGEILPIPKPKQLNAIQRLLRKLGLY
jgi:hypothetical protein